MIHKAIILAGALLLLTSPGVSAQISDAERIFQKAEDARIGTDGAVDIDQAIVLYGQAAAQGKHAAYYRLGQLHLGRGEAAPALDALGKSAEHGSVGAALLRAQGHAKGTFGDLSDPQQGVPLLEELSRSSSSLRATLILADLYADGLGVARNADRALLLYEQAAGTGSPRALRALGKVYLQDDIVEKDMARAIDLLKSSVDAGSAPALRDLGLALLQEERRTQALDILQQAAVRDVSGASADLANGNYLGWFGPASDPREGERALRELAESGDLRAASYALRHHERRSRRLEDIDLGRVLLELEEKVASGDAFAAFILARSYRTLGRWIPDARARHEALITQNAHLFEADALMSERVWSAYDPARHADSRMRAWQMIDNSNGDGFADGLLRLRAIERGAFVFALQSEMDAVGAYDGSLNGRATRDFITALLRFCEAEGYGDICRHGPLHYEASRLIAEALEVKRKARMEEVAG